MTCCQVELAWTAAVDERGVTRYRLTMDGAEVGSTDGQTRAFTVIGLEPEEEHLFEVEAEDGAGNVSTGGPSLAVTTGPWVPRDPADIAPALDRSQSSRIEDQVSFLYTGDDPIQRGVAPGTIEARRMCVLRGRVVDEDGVPLPGIKVRVLGHEELGYTATREDGRYDFVVNGGGRVVVSFGGAGFFPVQRSVETPWQGWVELPEVALIAPDAQATEVALGGAAEAMRGSEVVDQDGSRRATLVVPAGQQAELVLADELRA